jgi:hypothetical protein
MNQTLRTTRGLVVSALLLSAVAMAQAGAKNTNHTKSTEHHSKFSKIAFWRHHPNDAKKNEKKDATHPAASKQSQPKAAQVKPVVDKQTQASKAQVKPISAKPSTSKTDQKQNTTKTASPSAKKTTAKAPSAQPKKSSQKSTTSKNTQDFQKDSSKQ